MESRQDLALHTERKEDHECPAPSTTERERVLLPGQDHAPLLSPAAAGSQNSSSAAWSPPPGISNLSAPLQHCLQEGARQPSQQPTRLDKLTDISGRADDSDSRQWTSWDIAVELKGYIVAVTLAFLLTLAVFPGIATSICSSHSISITPPCTAHPHAGRLYGALSLVTLKCCVSSLDRCHAINSFSK